MHVASMLAAGGRELAHEWRNRVAGALRLLADARDIQFLDACMPNDLARGLRRDDAKLGLRLRQRRLYTQTGFERRALREDLGDCARHLLLDHEWCFGFT